MNIDWNDPSQAIPHTIHLLDAMKEDLALSYPARAAEISPVVSKMDDLLGEIERRMETRPHYFQTCAALLDLMSMLEFWSQLIGLGAEMPLEIPTE